MLFLYCHPCTVWCARTHQDTWQQHATAGKRTLSAHVHSHAPTHTPAHTHTNSVPLAEGEKGKEKKREKTKSIAGDSGARRRIVSCQNNILPSSPPDRCGGLGTKGSLSPLLSLSLFLPGAWCSLIFTSVKERPRRLSALIDSDTWGSVLMLRMREVGLAGMHGGRNYGTREKNVGKGERG